jgi:N-acetylglucosaminyldiphosphoundecaprenol N-acetyl-beta-D-mannosaminyltransferase
LRNRLLASSPDVVFVALGSPKQERVIGELRSLLPAAWWLGIGISFSFVSGAVQRAPLWVQRLGLEWLHRLVQEPRRLARRYLVDGLPFAARLFANALVQRLRGTRSA